jgi:SAM-dependent methyltransferase
MAVSWWIGQMSFEALLYIRQDSEMALDSQAALGVQRIKRAARRILIASGLRVQFRLKVSKRARADPAEVRALLADLSKLESAAEVDELVSIEAGEPKVWDVNGVREYLIDERILLFHDVISAAKDAGLEFVGQNVADIGSGTGYLLRLLAAHGPDRLVGYDIYDALNIVASVICPDAEIVCADIFKEPTETHDIVFCMETLEHQVDPAGALRQLMRYVKPTGTVILTVPNGRIDTLESVGKYPGGTGYYGHINFWSIESFSYFLSATLGNGSNVKTMPIGTGLSNLMAIVSFEESGN